MAWMNEAFKNDKRFLGLQLKRGKVKRRDIEAILATLPDVSSKAEPISIEEEEPVPVETEQAPSTETVAKGDE